MKKVMLIALAVSLISIGGFVPAASAAEGFSIKINGQAYAAPADSQPYFNADQRTMVPVRFISQALSVAEQSIGWDQKSQTVTIQGAKTIKITLGKKEILVDGQVVKMDTVAEAKDGRVFIPARFIAEALGAKVDWKDGAVLINTNAPVEPPKPKKAPLEGVVFKDTQVTLNSVDVVDGELRFRLYDEEQKTRGAADYRLSEAYIPDLNEKVSLAVKSIVDAGGFANVYYNRLEDGNGLVVIRYHISHTAYLYGNYVFALHIYEKPYKDTEKNITTNLELGLRQMYSDQSEKPYRKETYEALQNSFLALTQDEQIFDYVMEKYLSIFVDRIVPKATDKKIINKHTVYFNDYRLAEFYYNIQFAK